MPKKTKKQKLRTHRQGHTSQTVSSPEIVKSQITHPTHGTSEASSQPFVFQAKVITTGKKQNTASDYAYVKRDAIRITIFTFAAILSQVVLYFVLNK